MCVITYYKHSDKIKLSALMKSIPLDKSILNLPLSIIIVFIMYMPNVVIVYCVQSSLSLF